MARCSRDGILLLVVLSGEVLRPLGAEGKGQEGKLQIMIDWLGEQ